jgi:thiol-disulfide isomerase/thioredoxin
VKQALRAVALVVLSVGFVLEPADSTSAMSEAWRENESIAFAEARASGRHVAVVFGAEWCVSCKTVEEVLRDDTVFGVLSENFVPLHFDITKLSDRHTALQAKYHAPTLPAVIFVDVDGRELGRWDQKNPSAETFIAQMRSIVEAPKARANSQRVAITVSAGAFEPAVARLVQGVPAVLEFTRVVASECMNAVRMPWMKDAVDLPMNEKVEIPVDTSMTGVFSYSCWMDMVSAEVMIEEAS